MLRLLLASLAILTTATTRADKPAKVAATPAPRLHPQDEETLLDARDSIAPRGRAGQPELLRDMPQELRLEYFRQGLQKAAAQHEQQPPYRPPTPAEADTWQLTTPRPGAPVRHDPPAPSPPQDRRQTQDRPEWVSLLEAALQLEHIAHQLDRQQLWEPSQNVRRAAESLRDHARGMIERRNRMERDRPPHHESHPHPPATPVEPRRAPDRGQAHDAAPWRG